MQSRNLSGARIANIICCQKMKHEVNVWHEQDGFRLMLIGSVQTGKEENERTA